MTTTQTINYRVLDTRTGKFVGQLFIARDRAQGLAGSLNLTTGLRYVVREVQV